MKAFHYLTEPPAGPRTTLGDQVRAEAKRRGGAWANQADDLARQAVAWFGSLPCRGEDLHVVFGEVFRAE